MVPSAEKKIRVVVAKPGLMATTVARRSSRVRA
jgi:hypothetical protein